MNLLAKLKLVKLNQNGLNTNYFNRPFNQQQANQNKAAYFCEHDGICIKYTQAGFNNARSSWHAMRTETLVVIFKTTTQKIKSINSSIK